MHGIFFSYRYVKEEKENVKIQIEHCGRFEA